jgi:hypothetical protein
MRSTLPNMTRHLSTHITHTRSYSKPPDMGLCCYSSPDGAYFQSWKNTHNHVQTPGVTHSKEYATQKHAREYSKKEECMEFVDYSAYTKAQLVQAWKNNGWTRYSTLPKAQLRHFLEHPDEYGRRALNTRNICKVKRLRLWDIHFGKDSRYGECESCDCEISITEFEAGHVVSHKHGGTSAMENLRPQCRPCNRGMGTAHMYTFRYEMVGPERVHLKSLQPPSTSTSKSTSTPKSTPTLKLKCEFQIKPPRIDLRGHIFAGHYVRVSSVCGIMSSAFHTPCMDHHMNTDHHMCMEHLGLSVQYKHDTRGIPPPCSTANPLKPIYVPVVAVEDVQRVYTQHIS